MNDFERALKRAEKVDPGNEFVAGCNEYYKKRGFLTERQVEALNKVTPTYITCHKFNWGTGVSNPFNDNYTDEESEIFGEAIFGVPNM